MPLSDAPDLDAALAGRWLLRSHGAYHLVPSASIDVESLHGGAYVVKEISVLGAEAVAQRVVSLRSIGLAEGLVVSSVEVIATLRSHGIEMAKVPRGTRRWAVITTVMCKTSDNPVKDSQLFFFGEAHGPRMRKRPAEEASGSMPPRPQPSTP